MKQLKQHIQAWSFSLCSGGISILLLIFIRLWSCHFSVLVVFCALCRILQWSWQEIWLHGIFTAVSALSSNHSCLLYFYVLVDALIRCKLKQWSDAIITTMMQFTWCVYNTTFYFVLSLLGRLPKVDLIILEGEKCPSVRTSVRPSTKSFFDLNEIWYVGRGRWVMHDGMPYGRIQGHGQGHEPLKVWIPSIFKTYFHRHLQWELANDH